MKRWNFLLAALAIAIIASSASARGDLFDDTARLLSENFYDKDFRHETLPDLIARYQDAADQAETLHEERLIVHAFLSEIPASHLGLLSLHEYRVLFRELSNKPQPTFGFELVEEDGAYYVKSVLDGGPADRSGLLRGDRLLTIDGITVSESPRLDWRSDDAALPDPPVHRLLGDLGDGIRLAIERRPGQSLVVDLVATNYAAYKATKEGARVIQHEGQKIAYIHLWYIHMNGIDQFLARSMRHKFA
ncbi:MAG: PDZ domain-containing protein, partial [Planctomycetota bacterium]|nr:PDZ domain-containing protein [Planctomycetota bacterium]